MLSWCIYIDLQSDSPTCCPTVFFRCSIWIKNTLFPPPSSRSSPFEGWEEMKQHLLIICSPGSRGDQNNCSGGGQGDVWHTDTITSLIGICYQLTNSSVHLHAFNRSVTAAFGVSKSKIRREKLQQQIVHEVCASGNAWQGSVLLYP